MLDPLHKQVKVTLGVQEYDGLGMDIKLRPGDHLQHLFHCPISAWKNHKRVALFCLSVSWTFITLVTLTKSPIVFLRVCISGTITVSQICLLPCVNIGSGTMPLALPPLSSTLRATAPMRPPEPPPNNNTALFRVDFSFYCLFCNKFTIYEHIIVICKHFAEFYKCRLRCGPRTTCSIVVFSPLACSA